VTNLEVRLLDAALSDAQRAYDDAVEPYLALWRELHMANVDRFAALLAATQQAGEGICTGCRAIRTTANLEFIKVYTDPEIFSPVCRTCASNRYRNNTFYVRWLQGRDFRYRSGGNMHQVTADAIPHSAYVPARTVTRRLAGHYGIEPSLRIESTMKLPRRPVVTSVR